VKIIDLARFRREREAERMLEADEIIKKSETYGMCKKKIENIACLCNKKSRFENG